MRNGANRAVPALLLVAAMALLGACASGGGGGSAPAGEQAAAKPKMPEGYSEPPPGSQLAKVEVGMNEVDVRKVLGEPDNANAYVTGKAFIPFYYGPDTSRTDWMYRGQGRVVFSRNQWSGALRVINVLYNPNEQ